MSSRRPGLLHVLLLLPLVAIAAWIVVRGRAVREDPAAVLEALRTSHGPTVPDAGAVGATSRDEIGSFDRESLYQYIDGAADGYLERGFERCTAADYVFAAEDGGETVVTIEVYRFASPEGAALQLAAERPGSAVPVSDLPGAVTDGTVLLAALDRDYFKAVALTPGSAAATILERIAATIGGHR